MHCSLHESTPQHEQRAHQRKGRGSAVQNDDWPPVIAAGLFIAVRQGAVSFSTPELRMVLAIAAISLPVVNVLTNREQYNWVRPPPLQSPPSTQHAAPSTQHPARVRRRYTVHVRAPDGVTW